MHASILDETIAAVTEILGTELAAITIERAVIGLFFTGVKLSTGEAGLRDPRGRFAQASAARYPPARRRSSLSSCPRRIDGRCAPTQAASAARWRP